MRGKEESLGQEEGRGEREESITGLCRLREDFLKVLAGQRGNRGWGRRGRKGKEGRR